MSAESGTTNLLERTVTKELLSREISKAENNDVTVTGITTTLHPDVGENFVTAVYGIIAHTASKDYHLVVKVTHEGEAMKNVVALLNAVHKEMRTYTDLLPHLERFQSERNVTPIIVSVPRYFGGFYDDVSVKGAVILEDLRHVGFEMSASRLDGLDFQHCVLVMKELAKLHGLTAAISKGKPSLFADTYPDIFDDFISKPETEMMWKPILDNGMTVAKGIVEELSDDAAFKTKVGQLLTDDPFNRCKELGRLPAEPLGVVLHGDCHQSNMMFKYQTKDGVRVPVEVKLFDLQAPEYGLPTFDLLQFIFMSTNSELRKGHLQELLKIYHSTFMATLDHVNVSCPEFTFDVLMDKFKRTGAFGVILGCSGIPVFLTNKDNHKDHGSQASNEDFVDAFDGLKKADEEHSARIKKRVFEVLKDAIEMELHLY